MKRNIFLLGLMVLTIWAILGSGCKKSAAVPGTFSLSITLAEGTEGFPANGSHTYTEGQAVSYNYSLEDGYKNLAVTIDGQAAAVSGNIVMNRNHTLNTTAEKIVDISGIWMIAIQYDETKSDCSGWPPPEDPEPFGCQIVQENGNLSLTSLDEDNDLQMEGTIDEDGNFNLSGTITVTGEMNGQPVILDGTITVNGSATEDTMEGDITITLSHEGNTCTHGGSITGEKTD